MLALAHNIEGQIEDGTIPDYAAAAGTLGVTRARLTQVMTCSCSHRTSRRRS
jgi:hypothetical protein